MIEQMHPLRGKELHEIFPVLNYLKHDDDTRATARNTALALRYTDRRTVSPLRASANFIEQAGAAGHRALRQIEKLTLKNRYLSSFAKQSNKILYRIHSSDDPMKELGPGISTYHQLLVTLFCLFLILSLLHIPVIRIFRSYHYFDSDPQVGYYIGNSLGNMGYSKTECQSTAMIKGIQNNIKCMAGSIDSLIDWGVVTKFEDQLQCLRKQDDFCN